MDTTSTVPRLPHEIVCEIIWLAVVASGGSFAEFGRATSVSPTVRASMFKSSAVRASLLIGTHGKANVLERIVASKWVCSSQSPLSLFRTLLRFGASVGNSNILTFASGKGKCLDLVVAICEAGLGGRLVVTRDSEAFREACRCGNLDIAAVLLKAGADIHARADEALRFACCFGNNQLVQFLINNGANVSALYNAPLFGAVDMCHDDVALTLLAAGANPNIPMHGIAGGKSILQTAVCQGDLVLVEALVTFGANVLYENSVAKREAIRRNYWDIVTVLERAESRSIIVAS
ncbi:UNVERIFIED_CONTAM: hypothetical protein HDU68_011468 [Siphonaria sp. JEL0065]|nr:hypothetical protein HDU68_011468 [Siphonaria sp. JEL0065]